ncbi:hypothetical protein [Spirochaeta africana]|uniref:Uncharacterized protein n=1 Tax=Spirochaeta africana (strain ATCC 700263 / DSM 8902 / Z-7692) TaxID=889378 RepID=H9UMM2_SPIAZ|nr:hypothetical protein [Spirochaeta africana]AFG38765.1 hypothetical protein Spiaf_2741 [Spirochaeta africana DSM 8902]
MQQTRFLNTYTTSFFWLLLVLLVFGVGCATEPQYRDAPDWVLQRPAGDDRYEYFVGSALDPDGIQPQAEEAATYNMINEIIRFIGVEITAETSAIARSDLDSYQAELVEQVQQRGQAVVSGFQVIDSFVARHEGQVIVYLLGRYERSQLEAEQQRFRELFQEQLDAIDVPERRGHELYQQGRYGAALPFLLQAAAAAAASEVANADIRFDRNMVLARQIVENLVFEPTFDRVAGVVHEPVGEPIGVYVYYQRDGRREPVADLPIQVGYREMLNGRRLAIRTAQVRTDSAGLAQFRHPAPSFVGSERVTMSLDLSGSMEPLFRLGGRYRSLVRSLEDVILSARTAVALDVESRARNIPTAVLILDTDIAGSPIREQATGEGVREALLDAGFQVRSISMNPSVLLELSEAELLQAVRAGYGDEIERLVFGSAGIREFDEADGFIVNVSGSVQAVDIHSGTVLYTTSTSSRARAGSSGRAISSAFRNLGGGIGQDLVRSLP